MDARQFKPADDIDPEYGGELRKARRNGVEILVYDVFMNEKQIGIRKKLPFQF
jgi:sugar fermentation stimulation protein A